MVSIAELATFVACISSTVAGMSVATNSTVTPSSRQPCAIVSSSLAAIKPSHTPYVSAEAAYACLQSVPLDVESDKTQLSGLSYFLQWQTTLAYLKDPPPGYLYDGVDLLGSIRDLSTKLTSGFFASEYDFQTAVYNLIISAHDGHLSYQPDIIAAFVFERPYGVLSLSANGVDLPNVYALADRFALQSSGNLSHQYTPSPITSIDGVPVEEMLNLQANITGGGQDPDNNYNTLFYNVPAASYGSNPHNAFMTSATYTGPTTTFTFSNGTNSTLPNMAIFNGASFKGVVDGKTFFQKLCTGPSDSELSSNSTSNSTATSTTASVVTSLASFTPVPTTSSVTAPAGYPKPIILHSEGVIGGYFPSGSDVAVLSIPSFETDATIEFQNVARQFIATAQANGKTKLIIDLRGNGGGRVFLGYDLFKILFPDSEIYAGFNIRATSLADRIGQSISTYYESSDIDNLGLNETGTEDLAEGIYSTPFNYQAVLNDTMQPFQSWRSFFGPSLHHGDNFSSIGRYNFSSPIDTGFTPIDDENNGFANLTNSTRNVFAAEDVLLLQDGYCASTCAVFSEAMKTEAHVRQIAFGGRAQEGPMQGVGGVKGSEVYPFETILAVISAAAQDDTSANQTAYWNVTVLPEVDAMEHALNRSFFSLKEESFTAQLNFRNSIRRGDEEEALPLQFVYEAADCRLFYTADMYHDQSLVWAAAAGAIWGNGRCVAGSTGQPSSVSGAGPGVELAEPPAGANNTSGNETGSGYTPASSGLAVSNAGGRVGAMSGVVALFAVFVACLLA